MWGGERSGWPEGEAVQTDGRAGAHGASPVGTRVCASARGSRGMGRQRPVHRSRTNLPPPASGSSESRLLSEGAAECCIRQPASRHPAPPPGSRISSSTYLLPASALRPALSLAAEPLENVTLSALTRRQACSRFNALHPRGPARPHTPTST